MASSTTDAARLAYLQKTCRMQVQRSTLKRKLGIHSCVPVIKTRAPQAPRGMTTLGTITPLTEAVHCRAWTGRSPDQGHRATPELARSCGTRWLLPLSQGPPSEQAWLIPANRGSAVPPSRGPPPRPGPSPPPAPRALRYLLPGLGRTILTPCSPETPRPGSPEPCPAQPPTAPARARLPRQPLPSTPAPHLRGERSHRQEGASPRPPLRRLQRALGETPAAQNGPGRSGAPSRPQRGAQRQRRGADGAGRRRMAAGTLQQPPLTGAARWRKRKRPGARAGLWEGHGREVPGAISRDLASQAWSSPLAERRRPHFRSDASARVPIATRTLRGATAGREGQKSGGAPRARGATATNGFSGAQWRDSQ